MRAGQVWLSPCIASAKLYKARLLPAGQLAGDVTVDGFRTFGVGAEEQAQLAIVIESAALAERDVPDYIDADHSKSSATFTRTPTLSDVPYAVQMEPNLVIEYYSR